MLGTRASEMLPPMAAARSGCGAGVGPDGCLYVVGGSDDGCAMLSSCERYDPRAGAWQAMQDLPQSRGYLSASFGPDGCLYVAGGADSDALQVFDGAAWSLRARLPARRFGAASAACDGKLMLIGGRVPDAAGEGAQDTATVLLYDPARDRWEPGAPLPAPRFQCRALEHGGEIVVVGGSEGEPPCAYRDGAWRPWNWPSVPRASGTSCDDDTPNRYVYAPSMGSIALG